MGVGILAGHLPGGGLDGKDAPKEPVRGTNEAAFLDDFDLLGAFLLRLPVLVEV